MIENSLPDWQFTLKFGVVIDAEIITGCQFTNLILSDEAYQIGLGKIWYYNIYTHPIRLGKWKEVYSHVHAASN